MLESKTFDSCSFQTCLDTFPNKTHTTNTLSTFPALCSHFRGGFGDYPFTYSLMSVASFTYSTQSACNSVLSWSGAFRTLPTPRYRNRAPWYFGVLVNTQKRAQRVRRESFTWKSVQARLKRTRIESFRPKCTCGVKTGIFDRISSKSLYLKKTGT